MQSNGGILQHLPDVFANSHASDHLFHRLFLAILFVAVQFSFQLKDFTCTAQMFSDKTHTYLFSGAKLLHERGMSSKDNTQLHCF